MAKNCPASWARMQGDDRVRHCTHCDRKVYNLSEMPEAEASAFMRESEGRECIRFYKRADGTVMTRDCGVAERTVIRAKALAVGALTLFGFVGTPVYAGQTKSGAMDSQLRSHMKQVQLCTDLLKDEKDPLARKELIDRRRQAAEDAMALTRRISEQS